MSDTTEIRRGKRVGEKSVITMLDYCLSEIEENGISDGMDWDTKVSEDLTLEEVVGALVRSEYELKRIRGDYDE